MHTPAITLEEVGQLFDHWRAHKSGPSKIPDDLWQAAVALTEQYSISEITDYLRLNRGQFRQECALRKTPQTSDFVNITHLLHQQEPTALEFTRKDGASVKYNCPDQKQLRDTLAWFLQC